MYIHFESKTDCVRERKVNLKLSIKKYKWENYWVWALKCTEKCTENIHQFKKFENISKMNHYVTWTSKKQMVWIVP